MQYNRDRKGKTEALKEMRRRNRRKWDWEEDKSDWANSRKFPIGTVGDIECEPRTFNKHTSLSKEQLRCWNMVLYLHYWGYMYVIFQYREFISCSKWHPILLFSSLIETDYVQTLLIYVTADFYVPPGCLGADLQCVLQKAINIHKLWWLVWLQSSNGIHNCKQKLLIKNYENNYGVNYFFYEWRLNEEWSTIQINRKCIY